MLATAARLLVVAAMVASAAGCARGPSSDARDLAEQACELIAQMEGVDLQDTDRIDVLSEGLVRLDQLQQERRIPVEEVDAAMAETCPEYGDGTDAEDGDD